MSTITAQILVGTSHMYHGGINPTHYLFLSENSMSAWVLVPENLFENDHGDLPNRIVWTIDPAHALEDGMLMIALYIVKNKDILQLAEKLVPGIFKKERLDVGDFVKEGLDELRRKSRFLRCDGKMVLTVLRHSSLWDKKQLDAILGYSMDVEVCVSGFYRETSAFGREGYNDNEIFRFP
jgi:hypothetical protein